MKRRLTEEDRAALAAIVGPERALFGASISEDYAHDEMERVRSFPEALLRADSAEEVAQILAYCNAERIPVVPRGAGTGLVGGAVAVQGGVMLDLTSMNRIRALDAENMTVTVEPGVLLMELAAYVEARGFLYPPDPGEKTATIGGNISTNAGGMRAVKYGVTRDYVLAMTVVLPSGEIVQLGRKVCKTSSGYSLLHLMIGSEGTLGIITELTLKLIPKPEVETSFILPFKDISEAISSVPEIKLANLDPQSIEFMERDIVDASAAFTGTKVFPTKANGQEIGAYILVTLVTGSEDEMDLKMEKLAEVADNAGAFDVFVVSDAAMSREVWAARSAFLTAIENDSRLLDEMDVVVPVDRIAEFLAFCRESATRHGLGLRAFGHAGDGNLHIYCSSNELELDEFKRLSSLVMDECYAKCSELEGQVSGEHAIGRAKKKYLEESVGETVYGLMRAIKAVFDPGNILNPGKVCE